MRVVIFTDLDGTLLDSGYSFEEAKPALELIRKKRLPLVFCSSKTRTEIESYRLRIENGHPFISENGGGIFIPQGYFPFRAGGVVCGEYEVIRMGRPFDEIWPTFVRIRQRLGADVKSFTEMSPDELSDITGLPVAEAVMASKRDFGIPFVITDEGAALEDFLDRIEEEGFGWTKGNFYQMTGGNDKGKAVRLLIELYRKAFGDVETVGLGNGLNDFPMLREVDVPFFISGENGVKGKVLRNLRVIKEPGPAGWNSAVLGLLNENGI